MKTPPPIDTQGDTMAEPIVPLETLREQIKVLDAAHKAKGTPLSGRVLHVCHYLPIVPTLNSPNTPADVLSPPQTPPPTTSSISLSDEASSSAPTASALARWSISPRRGHTAMVSGIRSLQETYEQVVIAWTGVIQSTASASQDDEAKTDEEVVSDEEKKMLHDALEDYVFHEENESDSDEPKHKMKLVPVWMDTKVAKGHYEGYSKSTLWPLFHYLLWQDIASELPRDDPTYDAYVQANAAYVDAVLQVYQPGDMIFIHDYHLLLAPKMIRAKLPDAHIGLFIHAPFPSSEIFRCLPRRKEILEGMLGANLVCFQTYSYSRHFLSTCIRVCGFESTPTGVDSNGFQTAITHCPIGIDAEKITQATEAPGVYPKIEALQTLYKGKAIIVGREKLDVSKGVLEKLYAFEKFLELYPEWRGKVVLIQVTQPSISESVKLERAVSELVSQINGTYGSLDFTPVHHYHQTIDRDEYFALLSVGSLALITALRDGMNTTSMEFIIAQNKTNRSPLVLSEFMGTSTSFPLNSAILINPHDVVGVADAIHEGLTMSQEEKDDRHRDLYENVTSHTSRSWAATIVKQLLETIGGDHTAHQTPPLDEALLKKTYDSATKRLFLFDYDGTLTPIVKVPSAAVPAPVTLEVIKALTEDPKNIVYLISGRDQDFLEEHWGHLPLLGLSAEHGCFVRQPGGDKWESLTKALDMTWMKDVEDIFKYYTERTTGSFIEMKKASITWHYRASDPDFGSFQCKQCHDLLESTLVPRRPIEVLVGKKNLEVRPLAINKGEIVKSIVYQYPEADFVFCAGDDKTDEDMFRSLRTIFPTTLGDEPVTMSPPIATTSVCSPKELEALKDVELKLKPEGVFSTAVGPSTKKTLASGHLETPGDVVSAMKALL